MLEEPPWHLAEGEGLNVKTSSEDEVFMIARAKD